MCYQPIFLYNKEKLEKMHTKQLLKLRYAQSINIDYCDVCDNLQKCKDIDKQNNKILYDLLATREHIFNKQESKALRKLRKKQGN